MKFAVSLESSLLFNIFNILTIAFSVYKQTLRLNNVKTRANMNAKFLAFDICVEAILCMLLYNLHDCTFNQMRSQNPFKL